MDNLPKRVVRIIQSLAFTLGHRNQISNKLIREQHDRITGDDKV